ncbi:GumC family protein [Rhizobium sp. NLR9b]|uniref:GumC family protein n=1 Tax=unclassified Rhizobium TaxID=2613769 RepID=UPI001C83E07F|nr:MULTISPECIES: GumC family protein [unclassified Rhizobium]MBX5225775.1 GumC family protein [Rhizobium sp. NLR9b]MBX5286448.1 GumC family protein [Rhizobium sp. NLR10b]
MSQYDRNRVSRLPGWRSYEPSPTASEGVRPRSPVVRPDDFARPEPEPAPPPFVPPSARVAEIRRSEQPPPAAVEPPAAIEPPAAPERPAANVPLQSTAAPLLDLRSSIAAIWSRRLVVFVLALVGAVGGGAVAPLIGQKFTAVSSLYFDPRQIGLAEAGAQSSGPSPEMISALIDSQVQILTSGNVLRRVVEAMKLDQDPEFNGGRTDGAAVIGALQKAVVITRQTGTYVVSLAATTNDPEKSARLANQVVTSFTEEENSASNGLYENTSSTLDGRLADLRQKVLEAEQAVETFRADNDMAATEGNLISDQRLVSLNTLLVTAQEKTIQAKARADAVANLRVEDIVAGNQAEGGVTSPLVSLRQQYAAQAAAVGSLESQMGTRHPRLQAARSSLQSIAGEIRGELQRLATSAKGEYEQAKAAEDSIAKELAVQKALQATVSDKQVELNELQRKATAARDIYETVLKRSSQTSEEQNLSQSNIRVISPAEPPVKADGPGKKILLVAGIVGGLLAGFFIGAAFAILAGLFGHPVIRGYFRKSPAAAA